MRSAAVKEFEVDEDSTENMWYRITVKFRDGKTLGGVVVDEFLFPTMREAQRAFKNAGYRKVHPLD